MKRYPLLLLCFMLIIAACTKSDDGNNVQNGNNNNPLTPYYFNGTINGRVFNFSYPYPQYVCSTAEIAGGGQADIAGYPLINVYFIFRSIVKDNDMNSLSGRTFYFDGTAPEAHISYWDSLGHLYYSADTGNTVYNIKITSVTYSGSDTYVFNRPVETYALKGTCNAVLTDGSTYVKPVIIAGTFNLLAGRQK